MEHTKLPLNNWFSGTHLIGQAKTGLSALALERQLSVSCPSPWLLHQRVNLARARQDSTHRPGGTVQLN
jgi:hypothetical protein